MNYLYASNPSERSHRCGVKISTRMIPLHFRTGVEEMAPGCENNTRPVDNTPFTPYNNTPFVVRVPVSRCVCVCDGRSVSSTVRATDGSVRPRVIGRSSFVLT